MSDYFKMSDYYNMGIMVKSLDVLRTEFNTKSRSLLIYDITTNTTGVTDNDVHHCLEQLISVGYLIPTNTLNIDFKVSNKYRDAVSAEDVKISRDNNINLDIVLRRKKIERLRENIDNKPKSRFRFKLPWR